MTDSWIPDKSDAETAIDQLHIEIAERVRKFGRNFFTHEVEFLTKETLRVGYLELCERVVTTLGGQGAIDIIKGVLEPSYNMQKERFLQTAEV